MVHGLANLDKVCQARSHIDRNHPKFPRAELGIPTATLQQADQINPNPRAMIANAVRTFGADFERSCLRSTADAKWLQPMIPHTSAAGQTLNALRTEDGLFWDLHPSGAFRGGNSLPLMRRADGPHGSFRRTPVAGPPAHQSAARLRPPIFQRRAPKGWTPISMITVRIEWIGSREVAALPPIPTGNVQGGDRLDAKPDEATDSGNVRVVLAATDAEHKETRRLALRGASHRRGDQDPELPELDPLRFAPIEQLTAEDRHNHGPSVLPAVALPPIAGRRSGAAPAPLPCRSRFGGRAGRTSRTVVAAP